MKGLFVTATDTDVGKTLVTGALAAALVDRGHRVSVMKPVETGCAVSRSASENDRVDGMPGEIDERAAAALARLHQLAGPPPVTVSTKTAPEALYPADAHALLQLSGCTAPLSLVNPYRYGPAVAPAVAAHLAERPIDIDHLLDCMRKLAADTDYLLVEGAGGLLVPIDETTTMIDLIAKSRLPTLLVSPSKLGTINHTLLSVEALQHRSIPLAGIVLNRLERRPRVEEATNPHQIERFAGPLVRGVLPYFRPDQREDAAHLGHRFAIHVDLDAILEVVDASGSC